jgi:chromosomal replication initiation ATPase DnaA
MSGGSYDSWVKPLTAAWGYKDQVFTLGAHNTYDRQWVEERLSPRITKLLSKPSVQ